MFRPLARHVAGILSAVAFVTIATSPAHAQAKGPAMFGLGYTDIGPTIGLGGIGSANLSIGGRFEHAFKALPDLANGMLGFGVSADFYSYSNANFSVKYIPIGATINYHFKLDDPKIDPFIGAGLGYQIINCSYAGTISAGCSNSDLYFIGHLGARYFFTPTMSGYADVGAGAATLNLGVMFKLH